jgi:dipeptidyl aminopeptidase/acylaminoacyl peptidase
MRRAPIASLLIASLLMLGPLVAGAGETKFALTIDNLMRGPNLVGYEPAQVRWSGDSSKIYFQWKQAADPVAAPFDTYVVNRDGTGLRKLNDEEARVAPPGAVDTNQDGTLSVYSQDGDIVLVDNGTGLRRQVTKTSEAETNPRFMADGHRITFTRGGNLFAMSLEYGDLEQLTDIRTAGAVPEAPVAGGRGGRGGGAPVAASDSAKGTDAQEYLKKEQREMFETVRDRLKYKDEAEAKQKKLVVRKPFTLTARQTVGQLQLTPDGKYVLASVTEAPNGSKNSNVPNWITDSSFPEDIPGRARVGDGISHRRLAVIDVATGEVKYVEHGETATPAAQIEDGGGCIGFGGGGGFGQAQTVYFSPDGSKAVFGARSQDNKNCWYFALDPATAKARVIASEKDAAWLGGPGGGQGWLSDNNTFWFTSEKDGYNHLYEVAWEGGEPKQVTRGKFEIDRVTLSRDKTKFYINSSEGSPYEHHLWSMSVTGGARTRLTNQAGNHAAQISPDEKSVADIYSYTNKPPELYVQPNQAMAVATKITTSPAADFSEYKWTDTPIVEIPARDGAKLPAHLYKPANFAKGGPAVVFVHGSGYLQDITKGWSVSYYHEYLFHHFLMEHGYTVVEVDYRASKGYGRDWRTAIYRHMGGTDLNDEVDAAKWLVSTQGVDARKIGIYGGSYGGFITLMAMFTQPDVFAAGAALRPVSDWSYYNQQYSGNILNQPQADAGAYQQSSPIYFANGLKGRLLICHGMVDTNVQFVDTVRLVQRLIELRKENWELAVYPVEDHSFREASSWADEYKRIFKLFETTLKAL